MTSITFGKLSILRARLVQVKPRLRFLLKNAKLWAVV
jgi:hypothetical protein